MDAPKGADLQTWLNWQETLNPAGIELGLDRPRLVLDALGLADRLSMPLIVVAGTNGKGSTVAYLHAILSEAGHRVAAYSSPWLESFNESLRLGRSYPTDEAFVQAFEQVEAARGGLPLTWFEYRTLAVALMIEHAGVDLAVLEVGLGGRLDAVNLFESDVGIICAIGMDHERWLGNTLEMIATEKAGVMRAGQPLVHSDLAARGVLEHCAAAIGANLLGLGRAYEIVAPCQEASNGSNPGPVSQDSDQPWCLRLAASTVRRLGKDNRLALRDRCLGPLPRPSLAGPYQLRNAAGAIVAASLLPARFRPALDAIRRGLVSVRLPGRMERLQGRPNLLLDVAHNPHAARALAGMLGPRSDDAAGCLQNMAGVLAHSRPARVALLGMFADKNVEGVVGELVSCFDHWVLTSLSSPRGLLASELYRRIAAMELPGTRFEVVDLLPQALKRASELAGPDGEIVVFGSFETVRVVRRLAQPSRCKDT